LRHFSFGDYGLALAALALEVILALSNAFREFNSRRDAKERQQQYKYARLSGATTERAMRYQSYVAAVHFH